MMPLDGTPAQAGHNRAPLSKAEAIAAIEHWAKTRRIADALTVNEIGGLDSGARLAAFARSKLEATAHWLRSNPREDATLGVLEAIYCLSDNDKGHCDMAQERRRRRRRRSRR